MRLLNMVRTSTMCADLRKEPFGDDECEGDGIGHPRFGQLILRKTRLVDWLDESEEDVGASGSAGSRGRGGNLLDICR